MQDLLEILEDLVLNKLCPSDPKIDSINFLEEWITIANNYKIKFHGILLNKLLTFRKDKQIIRYVHSVQSQLISLSDQLFAAMDCKKKKSKTFPSQPLNFPDIQNHVLLILEELISLIEEKMPQYYNFDEKITEKRKLTINSNLLTKSKLLAEHLNTIDNNFLDLILNPYHEAIHDKKFNFTYRKSKYLHDLLEELMKTGGSDSLEITQNLKEKLIYYNFNSWRLYRYMVKEITYQIQEEECITDKLLRYYNHLKCINQLYIKSNVILNEDGKSLKEMLADWISEEIYVLEKEYQLTLPENSAKKGIFSNFKISISLSVPQLACLIRLFVKIGLLENKKPKELFDFLANHIQTKKSETLSSKNLANHYYEPDDKSTSVIKTHMIEILNEINRS